MLNTLRPRQNGRHFADDTFKRIFVTENVRILIKISLEFVPKGPTNNIPTLVQIMDRRRPGDKPLSEPIMVILLTYRWASLGLKESRLALVFSRVLVQVVFHTYSIRFSYLIPEEYGWIRQNSIFNWKTVFQTLYEMLWPVSMKNYPPSWGTLSFQKQVTNLSHTLLRYIWPWIRRTLF